MKTNLTTHQIELMRLISEGKCNPKTINRYRTVRILGRLLERDLVMFDGDSYRLTEKGKGLYGSVGK